MFFELIFYITTDTCILLALIKNFHLISPDISGRQETDFFFFEASLFSTLNSQLSYTMNMEYKMVDWSVDWRERLQPLVSFS